MVVNIGQVKMKKEWPLFLYHDKLDGVRRVNNDAEETEAVREGWRPGYRHQAYPKMMYHVIHEPKTVNNEDEELVLRESGWEDTPVAFTETKILQAKIAETELTLKELKKKKSAVAEGSA
jgi:hypothetical protein